MAGNQEKNDQGSQSSSIGDKAGAAAADAGTRVKELASSVASRVGDAASAVGKRAEDAASAVGSGMTSLGGTIREHTPGQGMFGNASGAVADSLERGGRYLQNQGLSGVGGDITNLIRRNPIPAVLIGIGVGFLLSRATSRS